LTQEKVAGKLGVSQRAVSEWENQGRPPRDPETREGLTRLLKLNYEELFGSPPPPRPADEPRPAMAADRVIRWLLRNRSVKELKEEVIAAVKADEFDVVRALEEVLRERSPIKAEMESDPARMPPLFGPRAKN